MNRLVGHVRGEVVVLHLRRRHARHAVVDQRIPLVRLASDEAVELVEALVRRPAVEGAGDARFPRRGLVPLAEGAGAVAVQPKHLGQGRDAIRNGARVAGKRRRGLHDGTGVGLVMVAASRSRVGVCSGPPNVLGPPKPMSSISTITTLGAPLGAVTSNLGGALALRASNSLYVGGFGS